MWFSKAIGFFFLVYMAYVSYEKWAFRYDFLAYPEKLSAHNYPIPTGAGVVFSLIWLLWVLIWDKPVFLTIPVIASLVLTMTLGFCDDKISLSPRWRLLGQMIVAICCLQQLGCPVLPGLSAWPQLSFVFFTMGFVWTINLFNFMDGSDGYASMQALIIFLMLGSIWWLMGMHDLAFISWMMVGLLGVFLRWNWPNAKMFMGDVGSTFLGTLIALLALVMNQSLPDGWLYSYVLLMPFFIDATLSLLRKIAHGLSFSARHRQHAFTRLLTFGVSKQVLLVYQLLVNLALSMLVLMGVVWQWSPWVLIAISAFLVIALYMLIEYIQPQSFDV